MSNYAQQGAQQMAAQSGGIGLGAPSDVSVLHGILRRIGEVRANLHDIHGIADRACGQLGIGETASAPKAVPNGMLAEIEEAMDGLMSLSGGAVARLSRIA